MNPYTYIGHPLIGNPHAALFYPATWLIWLVGADRGLGLVLALHVWLAAWGMARLARGFGSTHTAALLAGVVFGMSEWMGTRFYAGHYTLIMVAAWIPWAVAGITTLSNGAHGVRHFRLVRLWAQRCSVGIHQWCFTSAYRWW